MAYHYSFRFKHKKEEKHYCTTDINLYLVSTKPSPEKTALEIFSSKSVLEIFLRNERNSETLTVILIDEPLPKYPQTVLTFYSGVGMANYWRKCLFSCRFPAILTGTESSKRKLHMRISGNGKQSDKMAGNSTENKHFHQYIASTTP